MLSAELALLRDTFDDWGRGKPLPTAETWRQFASDLRDLTARLAAQEVGIELSVIDVLVQSATPGSNVKFLPVERLRLRGGLGVDRGGS